MVALLLTQGVTNTLYITSVQSNTAPQPTLICFLKLHNKSEIIWLRPVIVVEACDGNLVVLLCHISTTLSRLDSLALMHKSYFS